MIFRRSKIDRSHFSERVSACNLKPENHQAAEDGTLLDLLICSRLALSVLQVVTLGRRGNREYAKKKKKKKKKEHQLKTGVPRAGTWRVLPQGESQWSESVY